MQFYSVHVLFYHLVHWFVAVGAQAGARGGFFGAVHSLLYLTRHTANTKCKPGGLKLLSLLTASASPAIASLVDAAPSNTAIPAPALYREPGTTIHMGGSNHHATADAALQPSPEGSDQNDRYFCPTSPASPVVSGAR